MVNRALANKLTSLATDQLAKGLEAKGRRMKDIQDIIDLYNNRILRVDNGTFNIPFPFMAQIIDQLFSKIDNPPSVQFKIPNKKLLAEKVAAAWDQEKTSMRAGWNRKDRAEKKDSLFSGRGIAKIYATSINNRYESHYDVVDVFSFVADPTRGHLSEGRYHGETDIFRTHESMKKLAKLGIYDTANVQKLLSDELSPAQQQVIQNKINRIRSMKIDVETTAFVGQKGSLLTEWVMKYEDEQYYLLFEPSRQVWIRCELLRDVFDNNTSPFISWATHYDEFAFWTKGIADDIKPISEAIRILMNNALVNEQRRTRPQRIVQSGMLQDVNELMDYVPDDVIITKNGQNPNIVTVETPEITTTINLTQFLTGTMASMAGVQGSGVEEKDPAVGVFYGKLQQESDFLGIYNKAYSESYAEKAYNFFWGLKQHGNNKMYIEMLGKNGVRLEELSSVELSDVDDVDDVLVSGGNAEMELDAVRSKQQADTLSQVLGNPLFAQLLNAKEALKSAFKFANYSDESIARFMDVNNEIDGELMEEADEAIAQVLQGKTPKLNQGATGAFMQRILDYAKDNLDYVKLNKQGQPIGIDKRVKQQSDDVISYALAHQKIVLDSARRNAQRALEIQSRNQPSENMELPTPGEAELQQATAQPFENPQGTPAGTAETSQVLSRQMA